MTSSPLFQPIHFEQWAALVRKTVRKSPQDLQTPLLDEPLAIQPLYSQGPHRNSDLLASSPDWLVVHWAGEKYIEARIQHLESAQDEGVQGIWLEYPLPFYKIPRDWAIFIPPRALNTIDLEHWKTYLPQRGSLGIDPFSAWLNSGYLPLTLPKTLETLRPSLETWAHTAPDWRPIMISALSLHEAGASPAQELAYALNAALLWLEIADQQHYSPQTLARQMTFVFGVDREFFVNIAKLRAMRWLWNRTLRALGLEALPIHIHAHTAKRFLSLKDPWTNIIRLTHATLAAVLGQANAITTLPMDPQLPSMASQRLAHTTQWILKEESHLKEVLDPAGGSFYVETLTLDLAQQAWTYFQKISQNGGLFHWIQNGLLQKDIASIREKRTNVLKEHPTLIGIQKYATADPKLNPPIPREQIHTLTQSWDAAPFEQSMERLI